MINHATKPDLIFKLLAEKLKHGDPFANTKLTEKDHYSLRIRDFAKHRKWSSVLENNNLIKTVLPMMGVRTKDPYDTTYSITPEGWKKAESIFKSLGSRSVFIAMDFGCSDREKVENAITEACKEAGGWEAATVAGNEHNNDITDQIIADINRARFVVVDFTLNNKGAYFEAGYATGLGVPVIYAVKKEFLDKNALHFDTRQLNHIVWEDASDLKLKLVNRINAVINRP